MNSNFFGVEVELWRIGDSLAAPKFNTASKPNEWSRTITEAAKAISEGTRSQKQMASKLFMNEPRQVLLQPAQSKRHRDRTGVWRRSQLDGVAGEKGMQDRLLEAQYRPHQ